jgi:hypothetical protein
MRTITAAVALATMLYAGPAAAQSFGVATFFASVSTLGETQHSSGVQASEQTGPGKYRVTFTRPITSCAFVASPLGAVGGQASVKRRGQKHVDVSTFSSAGGAANRAFNLIVFCAP